MKITIYPRGWNKPDGPAPIEADAHDVRIFAWGMGVEQHFEPNGDGPEIQTIVYPWSQIDHYIQAGGSAIVVPQMPVGGIQT